MINEGFVRLFVKFQLVAVQFIRNSCALIKAKPEMASVCSNAKGGVIFIVVEKQFERSCMMQSVHLLDVNRMHCASVDLPSQISTNSLRSADKML